MSNIQLFAFTYLPITFIGSTDDIRYSVIKVEITKTVRCIEIMKDKYGIFEI